MTSKRQIEMFMGVLNLDIDYQNLFIAELSGFGA
jgi:hypothetical protein